MRGFKYVCNLHDDVIDGSDNMEKYAANLQEVHNKKATSDYTDSERFFNITYMTSDMNKILQDIEDKLQRGNGDAFRLIETPFGGGKTHTLIAAYHRAKQKGAKIVVLDGTRFSAKDTLWGEIEKQLEGKITTMKDYTSPGINKINKLLSKHEPVLILIDELLSYAVKTYGKSVGKTTLGDQTKIFIQELSTSVTELDNVCILATFLSAKDADSISGNKNREMLDTLTKIASKQAHKVTPISPDEVPNVIRRRLIVTPEDQINKKSEPIITEHIEFLKSQDLLPPGINESQYFDKCSNSYPFHPDVIDVLYEHWGTFNNFQRTRGVLRLLSAVLHEKKDSDQPFITLADFNLKNSIIRGELLSNLQNIDDALENDIIGSTSNSSLIERGVECSTVIFMRSFDVNGGEGATVSDVKRSLVIPDDKNATSAIIGDTVENLKHELYYITAKDNKYKFTSKPNINKIRNDTDYTDEELKVLERELIKKNLEGNLKTYIWPNNSNEVQDNEKIQLIILDSDDAEMVEKFIYRCGVNKRSNSNSVLVLCKYTDTWLGLRRILKDIIVDKKILEKYDNLDDEDKKTLKTSLQKNQADIPCNLLNTYSKIYLPSKNGKIMIDLNNIFTVSSTLLDKAVYEKLKGEHIHEELGPRVLKSYCFGKLNFINTGNIYGSMMRNPGSKRPINEDVIKNSIINGVEKGEFVLGIKVGTEVKCKEPTDVTFASDEVLIKDYTPPTCQTCKKNPCECKTAPLCQTCKKNPCECKTTSPCQKCNKNPCECKPPITSIYAIINLDVGHGDELKNLLHDLLDENFKIEINLKCTNGSIDDDKCDKILDQIDDIDRSAECNYN